MAYQLIDIPAYNIGNVSIPAYKKVIRDDGSYYFLGWKSIDPHILIAQGDFAPSYPMGSWSESTIANCDSRAVSRIFWGNNISGALEQTLYYRNPQQLVPFGCFIHDSHWRDGGEIYMNSTLGMHYHYGNAATWNGNIFTQLDQRLTDRRLMLSLDSNAWFHDYARRHDIHNDDYIERSVCMSVQQYLEPEQFYNIYGVMPIE